MTQSAEARKRAKASIQAQIERLMIAKLSKTRMSREYREAKLNQIERLKGSLRCATTKSQKDSIRVNIQNLRRAIRLTADEAKRYKEGINMQIKNLRARKSAI